MVDDFLWYIPVRWDRRDKCLIRAENSRLLWLSIFTSISLISFGCSILLHRDAHIYVNVPYTVYPRYRAASQRVSPGVTAVSRILLRGHPRILLSNIMACRRGLGNRHSRFSRSRLLVRNVRRARLQHVRYNRVRNKFIIRARKAIPKHRHILETRNGAEIS